MSWLKPLTALVANQRKGAQSELLAAKYLQSQGFEILAQNFTCKGGEIDIVAFNPITKTLHFIEVKARKNNLHGHPAEFVTAQKQHKITQCAQFFLIKNPDSQNHAMQFDVVTLLGEPPQIEWLQNAFGGW